MKPANRIINHLSQQNIPFRLLTHRHCRSLTEAATLSQVDIGSVARAVILHGNRRLLMAIVPANSVLDFDALSELTGERLKPVPAKALLPLFKDCEPGAIPPVARLYGLKSVIDEQLLQREVVYLEPGSRRHLLRLEADAFATLQRQAISGRIARSRQELTARESNDFVRSDAENSDLRYHALRPIAGLKERIQSLRDLPAMPDMAAQLLQLMNRDEPAIEALAAIIEKDPGVTAQLLRLARSPWYAYQGELESVEQAISRVLGFDQSLNIALGIATGRSFTIRHEGPLGLDAFWRHALLSANLCQNLARALPASLAVSPGSAYLAGLLHNIGYLVMGELLEPEYYLLNRVVEANPDVPVTLIEKRLLVVTHSQVGAWLMRSWNMPPRLTTAVREHHNEYYQGEHSLYAKLVQISDTLLRRHGLGDGSSSELSPNLLMSVGLNETTLNALFESYTAHIPDIEQLAEQLAA